MRRFKPERLTNHRFTYFFAALCALAPLGMDSYLPAVPAYAAELGISSAQAGWTLSNFMLGLALGQLAGGALSDQLGRLPIVLLGLVIYILSCLALILWLDYYAALSLRLLEGVGAGVIMVSGMAMLKDSTLKNELAERMAQAVFVIMVMPILAPILGALLLPLGWRMIFVVCAAAACVMLIFIVWKVPETHKERTGRLSAISAIQQFAYVFGHRTQGKPVALVQALGTATGAGIILVFVVAAPAMLMGHYSLKPSQFPFAFASVVVALLVGNRIGKAALNLYKPHKVYQFGAVFQFLFASVFVVSTGLFELNIAWFLFFVMFICASYSASGPSAQSLYLNLLDKYHGSATALESTLRFGLGGLIGGISLTLISNPLKSFALVVFCSISCSFFCYLHNYRVWKARSGD